MKKNIIKILKITVISIVASFFAYIIIFFLIFLYDFIFYMYWDYKGNKPQNTRYEKIFKEIYFNEMNLSTILTSRIDGFSQFYNFKNNEIYVMDSARFGIIKINETNINEYLIKDKDIYRKTRAHLWSNAHNSPINITFYINYGKAKQADVYIDSLPEKIERGENYLYLKFKSAGFIISSTKEYPELKFNCGKLKLEFEFILLKKDGKNYIILKYPTSKDRIFDDNDVSLLDMVNVK